MAVTIKQINFPGMNEVILNLGLGRAPRNTTHHAIYQALARIEGVQVENVGTFQTFEGVWSVNRKSAPFTDAEVAKIKAVAEGIAAKG